MDNAQELRTVRVVDRAAMADLWGTRDYHVIIKAVRISSKCAVCGAPRGAPEPLRFYELGDYHEVDTWTNDCGHVDKYKDVLRSARND